MVATATRDANYQDEIFNAVTDCDNLFTGFPDLLGKADIKYRFYFPRNQYRIFLIITKLLSSFSIIIEYLLHETLPSLL